MPTDILLSDAYNDKRRALIGPTASLDQRPGVIPGYGMALTARTAGEGRVPSDRRLGEPHRGPSRRNRAATRCISISSTAKATWSPQRPPAAGCSRRPTIPALGFCLGTRAQMFVLEEGHPASLAPGKRPRSTLSPTMALRDGEPYLAGERQAATSRISGSRNFFSRHVHAGMNLQESIDAPAWHTEHFPSSFWPRAARPGVLVVESRVPESTVAEFRRRRHIVEVGLGVVGRPVGRRSARRGPIESGRQPARHAGLCSRTLKREPDHDDASA